MVEVASVAGVDFEDNPITTIPPSLSVRMASGRPSPSTSDSNGVVQNMLPSRRRGYSGACNKISLTAAAAAAAADDASTAAAGPLWVGVVRVSAVTRDDDDEDDTTDDGESKSRCS